MQLFWNLIFKLLKICFLYELFDKRDEFPFSIVRMPDLSGNIPSFIFYGSIMSEFLRIARCTRLISDFLPRAQALVERMVSQGGNKSLVLKQIKKVVSRHPESFEKFTLSTKQILEKLSWYFCIYIYEGSIHIVSVFLLFLKQSDVLFWVFWRWLI